MIRLKYIQEEILDLIPKDKLILANDKTLVSVPEYKFIYHLKQFLLFLWTIKVL